MLLPQVDQFYHERIWPVAKLAIGASLMGGVDHIISSAFSNIAGITAVSAAEQAFVNYVFNDPMFDDVTIDFAPLLDYLPISGGGYDYISQYITNYVYGCCWV